MQRFVFAIAHNYYYCVVIVIITVTGKFEWLCAIKL